MSLIYDSQGKRKYLTRLERARFMEAATRSAVEVHMFCAVLAYTGARISEVLALTPACVDLSAEVVVFESLKKRRRKIYRAVPVPSALLAELDRHFDIAGSQLACNLPPARLWGWSRTTAWAHVKAIMGAANITGPQATAKGLRHGFAVGALQAGVPINFVRRWLGHSRLSTTEIYADAIGEEERSIARRFWSTF